MEKKNALVFVDYQAWFWGMVHIYGKKPNIRKLFDELKLSYNIVDVTFFTDSQDKDVFEDYNNIRTITSNITTCYNTEFKKNFVDFVMLDRIYMSLNKYKDISTYILITGDGHFVNVVTSLRNERNKEVGVIAVEGTLSTTLRDACDWHKTISMELDIKSKKFTCLKYIKKSQDKGFNSGFTYWAKALASRYRMEETKIRSMLSDLIGEGYLYQSGIATGTKMHNNIFVNISKFDQIKVEQVEEV